MGTSPPDDRIWLLAFFAQLTSKPRWTSAHASLAEYVSSNITPLGLPRFQNRRTPASRVTSSGPPQPDQRTRRSARDGGTPSADRSRPDGSVYGGASWSRTSPLGPDAV